MYVHLLPNPLNVFKDKVTIFTNHNYLPTSMKYDLNIKEDLSLQFVEELLYLTMEENGFSYFYPDINSKYNLCRFEWHYSYNEQPHFLRIGIHFKIKGKKIFDSNFYILEQELLHKRESKKLQFPSDDYDKMMSFIDKKIKTAVFQIENEPQTYSSNLYYVELQKPITDIVRLDKDSIILPSRMIDHYIVSTMILSIKSHNYCYSLRFSNEKFFYICAIFSLAHISISRSDIKGLPFVADIKDSSKPFSEDIIAKFYPNGVEITEGQLLNAISETELDKIKWIFSAIEGINDTKERKKVINLLFSYKSGFDALKINEILSLTAFVSCIESIAKYKFPEIKQRDGSRKVIVHLLNETLNCDKHEMDKWSKRIYNDHRSSFVHGANIRLESYSQNFDGKNYAGLPNAMPTENVPYRKQFVYKSDLTILIEVSNYILLKFIEEISGKLVQGFQLSNEIDFQLRSFPDVYLGFVNNGWLKISGS